MMLKTYAQCGLTILASLISLACFAGDTVQILDAWTRLPPPGAEVGAAYFSLRANSPATLVKITSPAAATVQLHSMSMKNGVMEMREEKMLSLPAGKTVTLKPGGLHVMLMDLKRPLKLGDSVALDLHLKTSAGGSETLHLVAPVRAAP